MFTRAMKYDIQQKKSDPNTTTTTKKRKTNNTIDLVKLPSPRVLAKTQCITIGPLRAHTSAAPNSRGVKQSS